MKKKNKKRAERSFSYSPPSTDPKKPKMAAPTSKEHEVGKEHNVPLDGVLKQIVDSIKSLGDRLENKIERLQTDMDCFRHEIKENLDGLKATINSIEKSLEQAWEHIEDHAAELKTHRDVKDSQQKEIDELNSELQKTTLLLNVEKENNIALENYTRRENLKFMNLPENRGEDCKGMITDQSDTKRPENRCHQCQISCRSQGRKACSRKNAANYCDICVSRRQGLGMVKEERSEKLHNISRCLHYAGLC